VQKSIQNWIKDETLKLLEEDTEKTLEDISIGNKSRNCIQLKKLLHSKGNNDHIKRQPIENVGQLVIA
jgi:hypothetical protein